MYTSIPTWTHSKDSVPAAEALSLKDIIPQNICQLFKKTVPISTRTAITCAMKKCTPSMFKGESMETETRT